MNIVHEGIRADGKANAMTSPLPFEVSRAPLGKSTEWTFQATALRFAGREAARVRPTLRVRVFCASFALIGLGLLVLAVLPSSAFGAIGLSWIADFEGITHASIGWVVRVFRLVFPGAFGLLFVGIGVGSGVSVARDALTFDLHGGVLRMKRPTSGLGREIPLRHVAAVQILSKRGNIGQMNLVLARPAGVRLSVVGHAREHVLRADAARLAELLSVPLLDHLRPPGEVRGGLAELRRALKALRPDKWCAKKLHEAGPTRMVLKPTSLVHVCRWIVGVHLVLCAGGVVANLVHSLLTGNWGDLIAGFLGAALALFLTVLWFKWFVAYPVVFDRARETVRGKGLQLEEGIGGEIPLRNIRALQILSRQGEYAEYAKFHQLNVVLAEPPERRIPIAARRKEKALRDDAHQLAQFLGVPLLG
ncbi:MAG: hypothetical protein AMK75_05620 [Planctomycetes bacterium SM23_65]|nr:MAG: hypothetical protein AMK75_05620 [Planctomycetes bacterium SM23_65]